MLSSVALSKTVKFFTFAYFQPLGKSVLILMCDKYPPLPKTLTTCNCRAFSLTRGVCNDTFNQNQGTLGHYFLKEENKR